MMGNAGMVTLPQIDVFCQKEFEIISERQTVIQTCVCVTLFIHVRMMKVKRISWYEPTHLEITV